LEAGQSPLVSVVLEVNGQPVFEVLKNRPIANGITDMSETSAGIIAVSKRGSGEFLYKIRPASETSVVFGKLEGGTIDVKITDRYILIGGIRLENNEFRGLMVGVALRRDGTIAIGAPVPEFLRPLIVSK